MKYAYISVYWHESDKLCVFSVLLSDTSLWAHFFKIFTVINKMIVFKQALSDPRVHMTDTLLDTMESQRMHKMTHCANT